MASSKKKKGTEVKNVLSHKLSEEEVKEALTYWNDKKNSKEGNSFFTPEATNALVVGDRIFYVASDAKTFKTTAKAQLIARVTFDDASEQTCIWKWGYTFEGSEFSEEEKLKRRSWVEEGNYSFLSHDKVRMTSQLLLASLAKCAKVWGFELVDEVRLGPSEREKFYYGLKEIKKVETPMSDLTKADVAPVFEALYEKRTTNLPENLTLIHSG